jgi:phosphoglycerate dehydrogenase-like enzyme
MKMKIVIHPAIDETRLEALKWEAPRTSFINAATAAEAEAAMPGAVALLGKISPAMLAKADMLQWVQSFTASLEHYMFPELVLHRCTLTNMRGLFGDVIADQVMGYILCFARNLHIYIRNHLAAHWEPVGGESARVDSAAGPGVVNMLDCATIFLPGSKLGIIGFGGIGSEIARRALAFGMQVRGVDRYPERAAAVDGVAGIRGLDALEPLLAWSDFAVIAAPHTPETERLFDARLIAKLRPTSYLINVGRGAIVVLDDLVDALRARRLAGAALDVFEVEPLPADHPLWTLPNVILTPHTAGYSPVIAQRHLETLCDNVRRFVRGAPLRNVVDKELWF